MLKLVVPADIGTRIQQALDRSGRREVGGIMMAEHVDLNEFVVRDLTIHRRGAFASFVRRIEDAWAALTRFFERTKRDYRRFNYIGEWHSHPSFEPVPSAQDHQSMREIILDASVAANFVVLMIVKLSAEGTIVGTVHTYLPDGTVYRSELLFRHE